MEKDFTKVNKSVKDMTILELIKTDEYYVSIDNKLTEIKDEYNKSVIRANNVGRRLKSSPIDFLLKSGYFETKEFIKTFLEIIEKVNVNLSSVHREFIKTIGVTVGNDVCNYFLKEEEKNETKGSGNRRSNNGSRKASTKSTATKRISNKKPKEENNT